MQDKRTAYKNGKLQLVCGLIAAAQRRICELGDDPNEGLEVVGVLVRDDQFAFARAFITRGYITSLATYETPSVPLIVKWAPDECKRKYPPTNHCKSLQIGVPYGIEAS